MNTSPGDSPRFPDDAPRRRILVWLDLFLDLLFPGRCAGCGRPAPVWCDACDGRVERMEGRLCALCGLPVSRLNACVGCRTRPFPFPVRSYARYRQPLSRALIHLKYRPSQDLADRMGMWLAQVARREHWSFDLIVPVPLGKERLQRRGYNQAAMIASGLAAQLGVPMHADALWRIRETRSQVGLDGAARERNVRGAFRAEPKILSGSNACLVDDLCTTGATLIACGQACREGGARSVFGLTVGRAA